MALKIYILMKEDIDLGHAINGVGHGVLMLHKKFKNDPIYQDWLNNHFRKVTCKVSEVEFQQAKEFNNYITITEMAFDGAEIGLVFAPRKEWPKAFKYFRLYK